ncbi:MAG: hypothetical protein SPL25_12535 [Succinivibrionaceae bacterium]|nr:hypothetical protein [Succinivibrionaceae bacterium]
MPFPAAIIGILTVGSAVAGASATASAVNNNSKAKEIEQEANYLIENSRRRLNMQRDLTNGRLQYLGKLKLRILSTDVKKFLETFRKIKSIDPHGLPTLNELSRLKSPEQSISELGRLQSLASSFVSGSLAGAAGGAITAFAAYGAAMTFAGASTGTAIATLSGAAATNATLAFFGGGSIAAGGLGMAGGTAVLGGLVAGPALLVMGLISSSCASANLDRALSNRAGAKKIAEQLRTAGAQCRAISAKADLFIRLFGRASQYFSPLVSRLAVIVEKEGFDYGSYSPESKKAVAAAYSMALTVKAIIDTPILTRSGGIDPKCEQAAKKVSAALHRR